VRRWFLCILIVGTVVGCGGPDAGPDSAAPAAVTSTEATSIEATSTGAGLPPDAAPEPASPVPSTTVPPFRASVAEIDATVQARMTASWRPGCPVPLADLRLVTVSHWGTDGLVRTGELIVHADVADDVVAILGRLWDAGFPIERMELVDVHDGDDDRSMAANNTSAFNCREIDGRPGTWSNHAFGRAIDVNPLVNPWIRGDRVDPPAGSPYVDRSLDVPGMIRDGDVVVTAFAERGWTWGGRWRNPDLQHFERP
jgi:poly-gamma-glutamate synthesis protein (capsule biosynthesis protein)